MTLTCVIIGVVGLYISIRAYRRQVNAQFLLEYTKRIDDIVRSRRMMEIAAALREENRNLEPSPELTSTLLRCLNLMSQLHYFSRKGYMPQQPWRMARPHFTRILRSPLFMREWKTFRPIFTMNRGFCRFVDRVQQDAPRASFRLADERCSGDVDVNVLLVVRIDDQGMRVRAATSLYCRDLLRMSDVADVEYSHAAEAIFLRRRYRLVVSFSWRRGRMRRRLRRRWRESLRPAIQTSVWHFH